MSRKEIVRDIFIDFFGEDKVDLQDSTLLVHFPVVEVSNSHNKSTIITNLFVKIVLDNQGRMMGGFTMNRSEYTFAQFSSGYSHSHLPLIRQDALGEFRTPCLGTGPIRKTWASLSVDFDEEIWSLFCFELDKYVRVESLEGHPYISLENIGKRNSPTNIMSLNFFTVNFSYITPYRASILDKFIEFIVNKKILKFNYFGGTYSIAMSQYELLITLSNMFIEWHNSLDKKWAWENRFALMEFYVFAIVENEEVRVPSSYNYLPNKIQEAKFAIGTYVCTFKGKDYTVQITNINIPPEENIYSIVLAGVVVKYIVDKILKLVNFKYGRKEVNFSTTRTYITTLAEDVRVL